MNDEKYMQLAIDLAKAASGQTSPNPPVGAVVVKNGEILGMGAHLKAGEGHAEVHALNMAGELAKDATIYVTLEPCSHHGKTPPCADLVIKSGIKRAVIAITDEHDKVKGKGIQKLLDAGIEVKLGVLEEEAARVNEAFFHYMKTKTPFTTLKTATTLDGKTATYTGDSMWITGEEARLDVHADRHRNDAILVGVGTVISDNPSLTTRLETGGKNPTRVILDHHLRTPIDSKVVTDKEAKTWIFVNKDVDATKIQTFARSNQVEVIQMETTQINISTVLAILGERGIMTLYVEGGATIHGAFLEQKLFQRVITYIAPKLIGGKEAPTSFAGQGFSKISETVDLEIESIETIGKDLKIIAKREL